VFPAGAAAHQTADASYVPWGLSTVIAGGADGGAGSAQQYGQPQMGDAHQYGPPHMADEAMAGAGAASMVSHLSASKPPPRSTVPLLTLPTFNVNPTMGSESDSGGSLINLDDLLRDIPSGPIDFSAMGLEVGAAAGTGDARESAAAGGTTTTRGGAEQDSYSMFPLRSSRDMF
jgi:hypothetical protein